MKILLFHWYKNAGNCGILTRVMALNRFWEGKNKKYITGVLTAVSVILFVKYILPLVMPFFLALCLISIMQPLLRRAEKKFHIDKSILAVVILLLVLCMVVAALWYAATVLCEQIRFLAKNIDMYEDGFCRFVHTCCRCMEKSMGINARSMEKLIFTRVDSFTEDMKIKAFPKLMNHSVSYAKAVCSVTAFIFITFIATILLAKDFGKIRSDLQKYTWLKAVEQIGAEIAGMAGHYIKAQSIIMCTIIVICVTGLWSSGIRNGIVTGILAGVLDALPFIGTGCVLVPVAVWQLIQGNFWRCGWVLLLYGGCALVREFLEPKLIGSKMGIYPVVILMAIYTGIKLYGLSGVILGPFSFLIIKEIYQKIVNFYEKD